MLMNLTGHHVDVTPALKAYVENKLARIERYFGQVTQVHVVLKVEKMRQRAEATVDVSGGHLFADAVEEDMYAAIDALADKLVRQAKRHKERLIKGQRHDGGRKGWYAS
jgi:putative sigma-54 modulation protein